LSNSILGTFTAAKGFGQHVVDINPADIPNLYRFIAVMGVLSIIPISLSKTSFAVTLLRFGDGRLRTLLWFIIISMNILFGLNGSFIFARCSPIASCWDHSISGTCWPSAVDESFGIIAGGKSPEKSMYSLKQTNDLPTKDILRPWISF
jgi:hypothetical protein